MDYQIEIQPGCNELTEKNSYCETSCSDPFLLHTNQTYFNLTELVPYRKYEITVSAKTKNPTYGPRTNNTLVIITAQAKPKPPMIEKVIETADGNLLVDFKPECPLTGNTEFQAHWDCHENNIESSCKIGNDIKQSKQGAHQIEIVGLEGGHFYDLYISAKVENCWDTNGSRCVTKSKLTPFFKEGIPSKPIGLSLHKISPSDAYVKWMTPSMLNGDSILDYHVEITPLCDMEKDQSYCETTCSQPFSLHTTQTEVVIKELLPNQMYDIKVSAKTKHPTYGPKTDEELILQTPQAKPQTPKIKKVVETSEGTC